MSAKHLKLGERLSGAGPAEFTLPLEGVTKAYAILGIRESGKSSLGTVMAEEYCKIKQPWISFDPAGNWWGLRAQPDGKPGGFPVVVFGGERGDLPLEKDAGKKIAEAITSENVFAVIDLKMTSKTMWRTLVRDIVKTLQEIQVEIPRMVFIEEGQEFLPQRPSHQLGAECKEIVERLVTLGGNWGYGATILGQRPAAIEKSALSQCETVFAFATQGKHDRDALKDWMESNQVDDAAREALDTLSDLPTGECFVWSPRFLKTFGRLRIRRRETLHPRDARRLGVSVRDVELAPVEDFVAKVRKALTKTQVSVHVQGDLPKNPKTRAALLGMAKLAGESMGAPPARQLHDQALVMDKLKRDLELSQASVARLQEELNVQSAAARAAERRLEAVRKHLKPEYDNLRALFEDLGQASASVGAAVDLTAWEPWLKKAGDKGCRRVLEMLLKDGRMPMKTLAAKAGIQYGNRSWREYKGFLLNNHLATVEGDEIEAVRL